MIQIQQPNPQGKYALFSLAFRPFFISAGISAILLIGAWLAMYVMGYPLSVSDYYTGTSWHSHEMLFGYITAVIAGFLLTAVRNWTGVQTLQKNPLMILVGIWILGRILPFFSSVLPPTLIAGVDWLFLPLLAVAIACPLIKGNNNRNLFFIAIIAVMMTANSLVHAQLLGWTQNTLNTGLYGMLYMDIGLIMVIVGRVLPFFTEKGVDGVVTLTTHKNLEILGMVLLAIYVVCDLFNLPLWLQSISAIALGLSQIWRLKGWYTHKIWAVPLVWVLHVGYAWIVTGFLLKAITPWWTVLPALDTHALVIGGLGMLTFGMMARVSTGHTGRNIHSVPSVVYFGFYLLFVTAVIRVFLPMFFPSYYFIWLGLSTILWTIAFAIFLWVFVPYLIHARPDGHAG